MSTGNPLIAIRLPVDLKIKVESEVVKMSRMRKGHDYSLSEFIREAIAEKLAHRARSKKTRVYTKFPCCVCGERFVIGNIAWKRALLTGEMEYCCCTCDVRKAAGI